MPTFSLPQNSRILVTGANGYIGSQKPWLDELFEAKYGKDRFESVILSGFEDVDALRDCMEGVDGVVHVASDVSFIWDPNVVIKRTVAATENVLEAASRASVKRVVLTSSSAAAVYNKPDVDEMTINADTWNEAAVKQAWDENNTDETKPRIIYAASKTEGERAAWRWMAEKKPNFVFNSVLPNVTFGKILHPKISGSTMGWTRDLLERNDFFMHALLSSHWFVDVEDIAKLHVIALLDPEVQSERIFGIAYPYTWADVVDILRKLRPQNDKIPNPLPNKGYDQSIIGPAKRAEQLLYSFYGKKGWTKLEESLEAGIEGAY